MDGEKLREALVASDELIRAAQNVITDYLPPGGISAHEAVGLLIGLLDGPRRREVQAATKEALSTTPPIAAPGDALYDSAYIAGAKAGYNCGVNEDSAGLEALINARSGYLKALKDKFRTPAPEPQPVGEVVALRDALAEVMIWIKNWDPSFVEDDEWAATAEKVSAALKDPHQ